MALAIWVSHLGWTSRDEDLASTKNRHVLGLIVNFGIEFSVLHIQVPK